MSTGFDPAAFLNYFSQSENQQYINSVNGDNTTRTIGSDNGPITGDIATNPSGPNDYIANPTTTNDVFVGTAADEDIVTWGSQDVTMDDGSTLVGANLVFPGGGTDRIFTGPGITAHDLQNEPADSNWTTEQPVSNDVIVIDEALDQTLDIYMTGARNPAWMQDPNTKYYDENYDAAQDDKIDNHYRVGDKDYRIDYKNGYSTYITNMFDDSGNANATIHYDDCDELPLNMDPYTPPNNPPGNPPNPPYNPPNNPPSNPPYNPPYTPPTNPYCPPACCPPACCPPPCPPEYPPTPECPPPATPPVTPNPHPAPCSLVCPPAFYGNLNNNNNNIFNPINNNSYAVASTSSNGAYHPWMGYNPYQYQPQYQPQQAYGQQAQSQYSGYPNSFSYSNSYY